MKRRGPDTHESYSRRPPFDRGGPPRDDLGHGPPFSREPYRCFQMHFITVRARHPPSPYSLHPLNCRHDAFPAYEEPLPQDPYGLPMGPPGYSDRPPGGGPRGGPGGRPPPPNPTAVQDLPDEPVLIFEVPIPKVCPGCSQPPPVLNLPILKCMHAIHTCVPIFLRFKLL